MIIKIRLQNAEYYFFLNPDENLEEISISNLSINQDISSSIKDTLKFGLDRSLGGLPNKIFILTQMEKFLSKWYTYAEKWV